MNAWVPSNRWSIYTLFPDLGLQEHRLDGDEYVAVIDEFMNAVFTRWPNVIVQVSVEYAYLMQLDCMHDDTKKECKTKR